MNRYKVARELDLYVDYYVTKVENMINDCFRYNKPVTETLETRYNVLSELQADLVIEEDGIFTVSGNNYKLACKCRDNYRACH